jgi:hypothetical protein
MNNTQTFLLSCILSQKVFFYVYKLIYFLCMLILSDSATLPRAPGNSVNKGACLLILLFFAGSLVRTHTAKHI